MRILFLNQYFPPDPAPTGMYLYEVAEMLKKKGHLVSFISSGESYYIRKRHINRCFKELKSLIKILFRGLFHTPQDLIISGTSPPFLLMIAILIALRHKAKSLHWAFDIYPELAVKLGELKDGIISLLMKNLMIFCYRACAGIVVLDEDMAKYFCRLGIKTNVITPWIFPSVPKQSCNEFHPFCRNHIPWTWIYSGNLGRAHEWETLLQTQVCIEKKCSDIRLVFQGGGIAWPAAQIRARQLGIRNCVWRTYVAPEMLYASLLQAHCCVVTQSPATVGLLWPSKLALLLDIPRPLLWVGSKENAIANKLNSILNTGVFAPGEAEAIADWLLVLRYKSPLIFQRSHGIPEREHGLKAWNYLVNSLDFSQNTKALGSIVIEGK